MSSVTVPAPRMVGRDAELRQLHAAVDDGHHGHGGTTFVLGEAGVGKSRLAIEAAERARRLGMRVLRGRASALGPAVPFRSISEALFSVSRSSGLPLDRELAPYRSALARLLPEWRDPAAEPADGSLLITAEGLLRLLAALGRDNGTLLVLEDLHDADTETLAVVDYLADNLEDVPVVLVATARSEASPALDLAKGAGARRALAVVQLERLTVAQVRDQVAACLGSPVAAVPEVVAGRIFQHSDGVPFVVEELVQSWTATGDLVHADTGWLVRGVPDVAVPDMVVFSVANRVRRLGPQVASVLRAAAVLGRRFPLSVVESLCGTDRPALLDLVRPAIAAQLVTPDGPAPDWYAFRHALTADALLVQLQPAERAALAGTAATVVRSLHPELPGEWCTFAAGLHADAGEPLTAGRLYAEAGRRTLAAGAAASAAELLQRAHDTLASAGGERDELAAVLELLLRALAEAGQVERALGLASTSDSVGLDERRRASLHIRLAAVAQQAGLWAQSAAAIRTARELLGTAAPPRHTAQLDVIEADVVLATPGRHRRAEAEELARRALAAAEPAGLTEITCAALELLGTLARQRDLTESDGHFDRMAALARRHGSRSCQLRALARSGSNQLLRSGRLDLLRQAHAEAVGMGAVTEAYLIDVNLVMGAVLRGEFAAAAELAYHCLPVVIRLRLRNAVRHGLLAKAAMFAHQGRRAEMVDTLAEFQHWQGHQSDQLPLVHGLCEAICALLEEDRAEALRALDRAVASEADDPTNCVLAGRVGLRVLLDVVDGRAGQVEYTTAAATPAGALPWNRQFLDLAQAVLLGRAGHPGRATEVTEAATGPANPFTMARHLGLRLVAEAALADGWGDPATWLRAAESYFHTHSVAAVDDACRRLLRQAGMTVPPRRAGTENLPAEIRVKRITVREYEVLRLVAGRLSNTEIGRRLYISPRTVEKHVASLVGKADAADRAALSDFAARVCGAPTRSP